MAEYTELKESVEELTESITEKLTENKKVSSQYAAYGNNKIIYDEQGNPNHVVWVPQFLCEDINARILEVRGVDLELGTGVHPAFIKADGTYRGGFWCCKYLMSDGKDGGTASVPMTAPISGLPFVSVVSASEAKGNNWHLMSIHEDAAVSLLMLAAGNEMRGNCWYGRDYDYANTGTRTDGSTSIGDVSVTALTLTGSGGSPWNHNGKFDGIADFLGNVLEYRGQCQLIDGQLHTTTYNDPSAALTGHAYYIDSPVDMPDSTTGQATTQPMIINSTGITKVMGTGESTVFGYGRNESFGAMLRDNYIKNDLLSKILFDLPAGVDGGVFVRNYGTRACLRGGGSRDTTPARAGVGFVSFLGSLTGSSVAWGFRACYFED